MPDVRPISFAAADRLGLGRAATAEEIAAWDVDVLPDGTGLPEGAGSVEAGEALFSERCAACHGEFAEGVGNWPELAGGEDTLDDADPVKTVGSYWPYLSTAWDYIHRSMPFGEAQSLTVDETYAITAYILYSNYLVEEDFTLTRENFLDIEMPNADGFFIDDRATAEYPRFRAEPCMEDCKETVEITMRATVLDVTPEDTAEAEEASASPPAEAAEQAPDPVETAAAPAADPAPATEAQPAADDPGPEAALDPELVAAGEKVFRKCKSCHQLGDNAKNRSGPVLNGVVGAPVGAVKDFRYSTVFKEAHDAGAVWDTATLSAFLANPRAAMKGTKMSFSGLKNDADVEAVIEYLRSFGEG
jgi:cytochrome c